MTTAQPLTPPPIAPGPGVTPPFAAPPREGHRRRLGIGITVGAIVAVLCCGGGVAGFAALIVTTTNQRLHAARTVVTSFMDDWRKQDYAAAYQQLCTARKDELTVTEFSGELSQQQVIEFSVGSATVASNDVQVPVDINFADGGLTPRTFEVTVDSDGNSKVCGFG